MVTQLNVEVISGNPHEAFVKSLGRDLGDAQSFQAIVGFLTQAGVNSIKAYFQTNPSRLRRIVVGHAGAEALNALAALKRELSLADDVLMIHLGRATEPVGYYAPNPFRPMMHSKIYYIEKRDGDAVAFVGSNNLTQHALGGANCEAAIRLQGRKGEVEFQKIRSHIDYVVRESTVFDPAKIDLYAALNTRLLKSMMDEAESDSGLIDDPAIVLAALRTKPRLPSPGEKLYFEVSIMNEEYANYIPGKKIELHLLTKKLSRDLRDVVQRSFRCFGAEVSMVDRTGFEGTQGTPATPRTVDWVIEGGSTPTLWHKSKYKPPSKALQILAVFSSEIRVKYDYFRSAPPLRFTSELEYQNPVRLRERIESRRDNVDWQEVPPEVIKALSPYLDESWFLVKEVIREKSEERPLLTDMKDQYVWRVKYRRVREG